MVLFQPSWWTFVCVSVLAEYTWLRGASIRICSPVRQSIHPLAAAARGCDPSQRTACVVVHWATTRQRTTHAFYVLLKAEAFDQNNVRLCWRWLKMTTVWELMYIGLTFSMAPNREMCKYTERKENNACARAFIKRILEWSNKFR